MKNSNPPDQQSNFDIAVLCTATKSNYHLIDGLDLYDKKRDAHTFNSQLPVIAHPPCAQWSRMRYFATTDKKARELAIFCYEIILKNGGILEHPAGSALWKHLGITKNLYSVNQNWFGFPARKTTYLWFNQFAPAALPLNPVMITRQVSLMHSANRSITPISFNQWLVDSIRQKK